MRSVKTLLSSATFSATAASNSIELEGVSHPSEVSVQVTNGTSSAGTLTCKLQLSNDNSGWVDDTTFTAATTTSGSQMKAPTLAARFLRVYCTIASSWSGAVTITVSAPGAY